VKCEDRNTAIVNRFGAGGRRLLPVPVARVLWVVVRDNPNECKEVMRRTGMMRVGEGGYKGWCSLTVTCIPVPVLARSGTLYCTLQHWSGMTGRGEW
jgi:hypothetical protein